MSPPVAFQVMVKPHGPVCNLNCAYCYYLSKSDLYPDQAAAEFRMEDETLESFTKQYIEAQEVPQITFGWQGGEPTLMGIDFFRRAVELQKKYRKRGMRIVNTLQTNGILLSDEWAQFFHEHDFLIGLSLDGPRKLHDAYRRDRAGNPTFEQVMEGLRTLQAHEVETNILTTVHAANAPHPVEVYRFLRDEAEAKFIQFIPIVQRDNETGFQEGDSVTERSVTGRQYGEFLIGVFDEWVHHDVAQVFVQIFDVAFAAWLGRRPGLCVFEETCGTALVLEHSGDLYACDHFVEPNYHVGNILETPLIDLVQSEQQRAFGLAKRDALPRQCRECPVYFICHGGCQKNRFLHTPSGEPGLNYLCEGYRAFFQHIEHPMDLMVQELKARRPPANVMLRLAQEEAELEKEFAEAGRNDPCPCGSGKKFKYCHGRRR